MTIDGKKIECRNNNEFFQAWNDAQEGQKAEICLLQDIDMHEINPHPGGIGTDSTLYIKSGNITLTSDDNKMLYVDKGGDPPIQVEGGTFTLKSGEICQKGSPSGGPAITVTGGNVFIEGSAMVVSETGQSGLNVSWLEGAPKPNIAISGGTFSGTTYAVECHNNRMKISEILASGYAFYDTESSEWLIGSNMDASNTNGHKKVKAEQLASFSTNLTSQQNIVYGAPMPELKVETEPMVKDVFDSSQTTYQWLKCTESGGSEELSGENRKTYTPKLRNVGEYVYYCKVTYRNSSSEEFSLDSERTTVTVTPKPLIATCLGAAEKDYDGSKNVINIDNLLPITLDAVEEGDSVTASAIQAFFPDIEPDDYDNVEVEVDLSGPQASNYEVKKVIARGKIKPKPVNSIQIDKDSLSLSVGGSAQLTVTVVPDKGTGTVTWSSDNPSVATVDSNGNVTIVGPGSAVITAAVGGKSASCTVTASSNSGGSSGWYPGTITTPVSPRPFLKDRPSIRGWDAIRAEVEKAALGSAVLTIDMNSTTKVPGSFLAALRGSEATVVLEMGRGITWSICGKDISAETVSDTDFSVKVGTGAIPKDLLNDVAGGLAHLELKPVYNGEFGFTATFTPRIVRSVNGPTISSQGDGYAGMYANLFSYNSALRKLEFVCAGKIREDGTVELPMTSASDCTLILSESPMGSADAPENPPQEEPENPTEPEEENHVQAGNVKLSKTLYTYSGKAKRPSVAAADADGNPIASECYTVSYQNNIRVGKAAAVIVFKDGYIGTVKKSFTIRPSGTVIKKIMAAPSGFTVRWEKKTVQTSGYQIQYSANAKLKGSGTHSILVKKARSTKKAVKKLKAGKKYYVRIRTYKTVTAGGKNKKIFSAWSKTGRVKTHPAKFTRGK